MFSVHIVPEYKAPKSAFYIMVASLMTPVKLPWALCAVFSFYYFWLFTEVSKPKPDDFENYGLLGGFCVWGKPHDPLPIEGCVTNVNSHMIAFLEDMLMTFLVAFFYQTRGRYNRIDGDDSSGEAIIYVAIGGIIFFHGALHFSLSVGLQCLTSSAPEWLAHIGWILYATFAFFLTLIIFGIGFAAEYGWSKIVAASVFLTGVTCYLAHDAGIEWLLTALFATSHPIGSVAGLLSKSPRFTQIAGWLFLLATIDGIIELTRCETFLKQYGGHIWYDLFLHSAIIAVLPRRR
jgi:hypothetical protein